MNCKYCNAELPEEVTLCPVCGKEQEEVVEETAATEEIVAEETVAEAATEEAVPEAEEAPEAEAAPAKASTKKTTTAVIAIVLVIGILIGIVAGGLGSKSAADPEAAPTEAASEETQPVVIPSNGDPKSALCKQTYTVSDEQAAASADVVVATMGDKTLTNGELQAYYWQEIYMFLNEYGSYAQYMGLDLYSSLDKQLMMGGSQSEDANLSWQQFFLDSAIATWKNYQSLALEAEEENYQLSAEEQEELATMAEELNSSALLAGFQSADELIRENIGAACTLESYMKYVSTYFYGISYYNDFCGKIAPTDAEVEAYYSENEDYFTENGVTRDAKFINIRHTLLQPTGGETGENGYPVYTDEAWETCRLEAEELYNKWQEGDKSEESFAQLAMEHSVDGSAANGGLYENVAPGDMVEAFDAWCFDESRATGDHGLVKTEYGYHIMFFSGHRSWLDLAKEGLIDSIAYDKIPETAEKYEAEVDYSLVELGDISFM